MTVLKTISYDPKKIIAIVAKEFHISEIDILDASISRHDICDARYTVMYFVKLKNPGLSEARIEAYFGCNYRACRVAKGAVQELLKKDYVFKLRFEICKILISQVVRTKPIGRPRK